MHPACVLQCVILTKFITKNLWKILTPNSRLHNRPLTCQRPLSNGFSLFILSTQLSYYLFVYWEKNQVVDKMKNQLCLFKIEKSLEGKKLDKVKILNSLKLENRNWKIIAFGFGNLIRRSIYFLYDLTDFPILIRPQKFVVSLLFVHHLLNM